MQALFIFFLRKNDAIYRIFYWEWIRNMKDSLLFLSKFFYTVAILCWCNVGYSDDTSNIYLRTICPSGQYVYKCGNYRVGFNWLKGMTKTETITNTTEQACTDADGSWADNTCTKTITTNNYYISDNTAELFEQMRNFFAGNDMKYCAIREEKTSSCTATNNTSSKEDRDTILANVCDLSDSSTAVTCATCPNSAKVPDSVAAVYIPKITRSFPFLQPISSNTITLPESNKTKTISELSATNSAEWVSFHTIADCYMDEFTDSTGTYKYVESDTNQTAKECYYVNTNPDALSDLQGDSIENFTAGGNSPTVLKVVLPTSGGIFKKSL